MTTPFPAPQAPRPPLGDPVIDDRLARLAARRNTQPAGMSSPTPPPSNSSGSKGRKHAARGSRTAALALSVTTTLGLAGFLKSASDSTTVTTTASDAAGTATVATVAATTADTTATTAAAAAATSADTTATTAAAATEAAAEVAVAAASTSTGLADGTYTGDSFTNRWGDVQVEITVSGGQITDVNVLEYPTGHESDEINAAALPILIQQTLTAQSADVNSVSGATYTSEGYQQSLQTAIDAALAAINA